MRIYPLVAFTGLLWTASGANATTFTWSDPVGDLLSVAVEPLLDVTEVTADVTASTLTITMTFTSPDQLERIGGVLEFDTNPDTGWPSVREDYGYDTLMGRDYSLWFYPVDGRVDLLWVGPDYIEHLIAVLRRTVSGNSVSVAIPFATGGPDTGLLVVGDEFGFNGMIGHDYGMTEFIPNEGWYRVPEPALGLAALAAACLTAPKFRRAHRFR